MKNKIKKVLLGMSLAVIGFFSVGLTNVCAVSEAAASNNTTQKANSQSSTSSQELAQKIDNFQKIGQGLYAITWPLIIIAGKFMSNDVIYAKFIGMDDLLWGIWNVMRTFANYIIGFLLIFSIFITFLAGGKFEQFNPIKILPQLVVSAILVNASWFLIKVCLDVSTILTYSIGFLPLHVASDKFDFENKVIPQFAIKIQNDKEPIKVGVMEGGKMYPFCEMTSLTGESGVKYISKNAGGNGCVVDWDGIYYKVLQDTEIKEGETPKSKGLAPVKGKTFKQLMEKNPGMETILGTLYGSITNIGRTVSSTTGSTGGLILDLLFKTIFLFALVIPLFTFTLLMIARAVILWIYIIISPIVFLFTSVKGFGSKLLGEKGSLKEVCCMVFLPVTVTFALSLSFVFLSVLTNNNIKVDLGIEGEGNKVYIPTDGLKEHRIEITYKDTGQDSALTNLYGLFQNTVAWIIKLMFAIGFMWTLVFTALKSCKVTHGIAASIEGFSKKMVKAAPILPFAGGQSLSSLAQGLGTLQNLPKSKQETQFRENIQPLLNEMQRGMSGNEEKSIEESTKSVSAVPQNTTKIVTEAKDKKFDSDGDGVADKKIGDTTFGEIASMTDATKKAKAIESLASVLGLDKSTLENLVNDSANTNEKVLGDKTKREIKKMLLRKALEDAAKTKNITIQQLDDTAKGIIAEILEIDVSKIKEDSEDFVKALYRFGIKDKKTIAKLIAKGLTGEKVDSEITEFVEGVLSNMSNSSNSSNP